MSIAENLRTLLRQRGWSETELARRAGVSQATINNLLNANQLTSRRLPEIARALGVQPWDLDPGLLPSNAPAPTSGGVPAPQFLGARDLPIFSAAEGGDGEVIVSSDPIDLVARPWFLGEVRDGYGVLVVGESMVPVYEPGDIVIVNPRLPPMKGKHHILFHDDGNGAQKATIKKIVGWSSDEWMLEQYNPQNGKSPRFSLPRDVWGKVVRIVGKYEGN